MDWLRRFLGPRGAAPRFAMADPEFRPVPEDRGALGPFVPRSRDEDERLLASLPPGSRDHARTAYLARTEPGTFGSRSGFGGQPFLHEGIEHPACGSCGRPMQLLAQLETASLPPGIARGDGLIQVFYCGAGRDYDPRDDDAAGYEPFSPVHAQRLVASTGAGVVSTAGVPLPSHRIVGWDAVPDMPDYFELQALGVDVGEPSDEVEPFPYEGDKLGGWPRWIQGIEYPDCPQCGTTMGLVLQVDSERTLPIMFGDMGTGHLTQCPEHPAVLGFGWACS